MRTHLFIASMFTALSLVGTAHATASVDDALSKNSGVSADMQRRIAAAATSSADHTLRGRGGGSMSFRHATSSSAEVGGGTRLKVATASSGRSIHKDIPQLKTLDRELIDVRVNGDVTTVRALSHAQETKSGNGYNGYEHISDSHASTLTIETVKPMNVFGAKMRTTQVIARSREHDGKVKRASTTEKHLIIAGREFKMRSSK